MPDVFKAFKGLVENKGALYVADSLNHKTTSIIERWLKEGSIPESRFRVVYTLLQDEGVL